MKKKHLNRRLLTRIKLLWARRFGVVPLHNSLDHLSAWFQSSIGTNIQAREQALIDEQLEDLFGFHLMQLSVVNSIDLARGSRISHKFSLYPKSSTPTDGSDLSGILKTCGAVADFSHLPLPPNSIDLVIAHHLLDFSQNPHHLLREVSNVLVSHGYLLVVGFNPWSFMGLRRWILRWFSRSPQWRQQGLSVGRVTDWMRVLDLTPVCVEQGFYLPICAKQGIGWWASLEKWLYERGLPCGGFYLIVARKDSYAVPTPKPQWQTYSGFHAWGVTKILGRATRNQKIFTPLSDIEKGV